MRFTESHGGPLSPEVGGEYRETILERGTLDPRQAVREFLGRAMGFEAFEAHYRKIAEEW